MINFNDLPNDIKLSIFKMNRQDTSNEIKKNIMAYDINVVDELEYLIKETHDGYYDKEEEEEYNDLEYTFSKCLFTCILDSKIDSIQEENLDLYYDYQVKIAEAEDSRV